MGRYFQTASPNFKNDYLYTPPWEMMKVVADKEEAEINNIIQQSELFKDALLKIQHLNGPDDIENVKNSQNYWNTKIDNLTGELMGNKGRHRELAGVMKNLGKELQEDFTKGQIADIQSSPQALAAWENLDATKELKKKDPQRYLAFKNKFMQDYLANGGNSLNGGGWKGRDVTQDVDWNKIWQEVKDVKARGWAQAGASPDGRGYIWKNKSTGESVTEDRLNEIILAQVMTPQNLASLRDSQMLGLGTYFDKNGNLDYYGASGFLPSRKTANARAWFKESKDADVNSDSTWISNQNRAWEQHKWNTERKDKENDRYWEAIKERNKYEPGSEQYAFMSAYIDNLTKGDVPLETNISDVSFQQTLNEINDPNKKGLLANVLLQEATNTKNMADSAIYTMVAGQINSGQIKSKEDLAVAFTNAGKLFPGSSFKKGNVIRSIGQDTYFGDNYNLSKEDLYNRYKNEEKRTYVNDPRGGSFTRVEYSKDLTNSIAASAFDKISKVFEQGNIVKDRTQSISTSPIGESASFNLVNTINGGGAKDLQIFKVGGNGKELSNEEKQNIKFLPQVFMGGTNGKGGNTTLRLMSTNGDIYYASGDTVLNYLHKAGANYLNQNNPNSSANRDIQNNTHIIMNNLIQTKTKLPNGSNMSSYTSSKTGTTYQVITDSTDDNKIKSFTDSFGRSYPNITDLYAATQFLNNN